MGLVKSIAKAIQHKIGKQNNSTEEMTRIVHIDLGPPRPGFRRKPGSIPTEIKVIKILIRETKETVPIVGYLSHIADLVFVAHESEVLYGGADYLLGKGTDVMITVIPAQKLCRLPRRLRRRGWMYVSITCNPKDERFDSFPGYEVIPAGKILPSTF